MSALDAKTPIGNGELCGDAAFQLMLNGDSTPQQGCGIEEKSLRHTPRRQAQRLQDIYTPTEALRLSVSKTSCTQHDSDKNCWTS